MSSRPLTRADGLVLATTVIWGCTFPVGKHVLTEMAPMAYATTRYFSSALLLLALLAWRDRSIWLSRRDLLAMFGLGLIGIGIFQTLWVSGLALTTASKGAIIVSTSPIWAAFFSIFGKQRPGLKTWIGVALSLAGVVLVVDAGRLDFTFDGRALLGDMLFFLGAGAWAAYSVLSPRHLMRLGPLKVTAWTMLFGAMAMAPFAATDIAAMSVGDLSASVWVGFIYTAVLSAALGFVWWYEGIRVLGVTRTMLYSYLIPVFAVGSAALFLGETLTWVQAVGAGVVLLGIRIARGA